MGTLILAGLRLSGLVSWETQGPSTALGMTDFCGAARARTLAPTLIRGSSTEILRWESRVARLRFLRMTVGFG
jgi:hypothetical protein